MNFAKMVAPANLPPPQASFQLALNTSDHVVLDCVLQYVPPDALHAEQEREQRRIIGTRQWNAAEDLVEQQQQVKDLMIELVAARIIKFENVKVRHLISLIQLDKEMVRQLGLDMPIDLDPADPSPVDDEYRNQWGWGPEITTKGQAAAANIRNLLRFRHEIRDKVFHIITDVSYFQGKGWADELKNSGSGAASNSAPA